MRVLRLARPADWTSNGGQDGFLTLRGGLFPERASAIGRAAPAP
jgi:hypothetical protein